MKAVVFTQEGNLQIENRKIPEIDDDEVLVKVKEVGLDGTDMEIIKGNTGQFPEGSKRLVLGHESLEKIEKVGNEIEEFEPGDLVAATVRRDRMTA